MRRNLVETTATLRQREAEAQAMLRGVVEGVFAVDADRVVRYLNPQAERMAGVASSEALGRFCGDVLKPCVGKDGRRPCETACPILAARERDQAQATEFMDRPDGSKRTVIITSARMVDGLQVQVMRDETALESARRARDSILANISHEFRTPLAAQLASLELLEDNLQELPREQLARAGRHPEARHPASHAAHRQPARERSHRVRASSASARSRSRSRMSCARRVNSSRACSRSAASRSSVALPEDLPDVVGDAPRLTQVFVNLLANANKFGPEGGPIRIGGELAGAEVRVWVEDEGPGVADPEQGSIFERFYRAADSEPEPRGLGLGLWIVKSIVERHGGRVAAERTPAGRTRFTITLPVAGAGQ